MTWCYSTLRRGATRECSSHLAVPWQLCWSTVGLRHNTTQVVPLSMIRHLSSSSSVKSSNTQLTESVKATSETQDVKAMDALLEAVRKSLVIAIHVAGLTPKPGARSNPAYRKYGLHLRSHSRSRAKFPVASSH